MKVLVIGRQGQLAQCFGALPRQTGVDITLAGRAQADLGSPDAVSALVASQAPDVMINTAAYTAVDKAESEPAAAHALNAAGAETAARAAAEHGVPVIHVSTDYVFDGTKPAPYVEGDPTGPAGAYGRSKLEGEARVAGANPRHVIARTSWLMSACGSNFMRTMLRLAAERDELRVVADQIGSPTYAPDLAGALIGIARAMRGAEAHDPRWGIYHVANRGFASWHEVASHVVSVSAAHGRRAVPVHAITTAEYPTPAARPHRSMLDCGKLERTFGIVLPDWRESIGSGVRLAIA